MALVADQGDFSIFCPNCAANLRQPTRLCGECGERLVCPHCKSYCEERNRPYNVLIVRSRCLTCNADFSAPLDQSRRIASHDQEVILIYFDLFHYLFIFFKKNHLFF